MEKREGKGCWGWGDGAERVSWAGRRDQGCFWRRCERSIREAGAGFGCPAAPQGLEEVPQW